MASLTGTGLCSRRHCPIPEHCTVPKGALCLLAVTPRCPKPRWCLVTPKWAVVLTWQSQSNYAGANGHPSNVGDRCSHGAREVPELADTHDSGCVPPRSVGGKTLAARDPQGALSTTSVQTPRHMPCTKESRLLGTTVGSGAPARRPRNSCRARK